MRRPLLPALVAITLASAVAHGHDMWLVPGDAAPGKPVTVRVNVGTIFPESEHASDTSAFSQYIVAGPKAWTGKLSAQGKDGKSGLLRFDAGPAGVYAVAIETKPKLITLAADAFNNYLITDGLPHIYRLRAKEKTLDQPGRERYSRSPKALVQIGDAQSGDPCRALGLTLEIVPLRNPFALRAGETLGVRVLFRGKPLPEANLGWQRAGDGDLPRGTVRTDAMGEALVPIDRPGLMAIRLTHMTRPRAADYEWESFWTTLTFHIPG